jgi:homoserine dehydrogenase
VQRAVRVGLIGFGTIGTGVVKLLKQNREQIRDRVGVPVDLVRIADIDTKRDRGVKLAPGVLVPDARAVLDDPSIDVVIELMGGTGLARRFVLEAVAANKDVVTANKALLAHHGPEVFAAVERAGGEIGFEASVGGGIPIIRALRESLGGDRHDALYGIVNGTTNYILSRMSQEGGDFETVLRDAQAAGLAEADPTFDVDGIDAAHKLTLLIQLAFGCRYRLGDVATEGIRRVAPEDIAYAREFGFVVKHLAVAVRHKDRIEARVHPAMVPRHHPLADIGGALNAVVVESEALSTNMYVGLGAGMMPTATAVVGDLMEIARNRVHGCRGRVPPLGYPLARQIKTRPLPPAEGKGTYYLRLRVVDQPGVMAKISGILGRAKISIASMIQREPSRRGPVTMVFQTHRASDKAVRRAVAVIDRHEAVRGKCVVIRTEESLAG